MALPLGTSILLKVGALASQSTRAPVTGAGLLSVIGTSTGISIGENEISTTEFGVASSMWADGAVVGKNWSVPFAANLRLEAPANALIENTGLTTNELYLEYYPLGDGGGKPKYTGYATVNGYSHGAPADNLITASATLQGRAGLTKTTVAA